MSNHLAIATVTAALGQIAHAAAEDAVSGVMLQFGRPILPANGTEKRLFVYLFQVTPNVALRNADLPSRDARGQVTRRPQAALDLHYLLAFTGDDRLHEAQRMLGAVARDLHARPVLGKSAIANAVASASELAASDLGDAIEQVKFTPVALPLEELSKLWSVLLQTPHALALVYQASVVVIDALEGGTAALPVLRRGEDDRGVDTVLGAFPRIERLWLGTQRAHATRPLPVSQKALGLGMRIVVFGGHFGGEETHIRLRKDSSTSVELAAVPGDAPDTLLLDLPDDEAAQDAFRAGIYSVAVVTQRKGKACSSNELRDALSLAPTISAITPNPATRDAAGSVTITVRCRPRVHPEQTVSLLLADQQVRAEPRTEPSDTVQFVVVDAPQLTDARIRLRVDDAESLLFRFDEATGGFVFDDAQQVTIQ